MVRFLFVILAPDVTRRLRLQLRVPRSADSTDSKCVEMFGTLPISQESLIMSSAPSSTR